MLKNKKTTKPTKKDEAKLTAAMDELAKQTEALLGSTEPKKSKPAKKPTIPKKKTLPKSRGTSFDIIAQPKRSKKLKATLKTAAPKAVAAKKTAKPDHQISEHATKSFNEATASDKPDKLKTPKASAVTPSIMHQKGHLQLDTDPEPGSQESSEEDAPAAPPSAAVARTGIKFTETENETPQEADSPSEAEPSGDSDVAPQDDVANDEENNDVIDLKKEPEANNAAKEFDAIFSEDEPEEGNSKEDEPEEDEPEEAKEPTAYNSGELYANNLVKAKKAKGYKAPESQQKPTVFDTNEYHVELNDWSKLDHGPSGKWIIFFLLIVVLGAVVYLFVLGQPLPFVNVS